MTAKRKITTTLLTLIFITAFWFLGVDLSWFVEDCPDCDIVRDVVQYRVFTIPIYQKTREVDTLLSKVARDVGAECKHPNLKRWHKHRWWGLVICACPCINGIYALADESTWYDEKARAIVRELAKNNPSLRHEIAERVLKNHDWAYWHSFLKQVKSLRGVKPEAIN